MPYREIAISEILKIDDNGTLSFGAQQTWYTSVMQRNGGCAATTCADQLYYLSRTQPSLCALCPYDASTREGILPLMEDMWHYIERSFKGVDKISMLSDGALRYARDKGCSLRHRSLDIPMNKKARPAAGALMEYVQQSIDHGEPIAFLNLSNGDIERLPNWHWMMLIGVDDEKGTIKLLDEGKSFEVDIQRWLETTLLGGGFVSLI